MILLHLQLGLAQFKPNTLYSRVELLQLVVKGETGHGLLKEI